jgi:peptidyl-prolyl cis-trans isomerase C
LKGWRKIKRMNTFSTGRSKEEPMLKRTIALMTIAVLTAVVAVSCSEKKDKLEVNNGLDARVGSTKITKREIDDKFETMSPQMKAQYKGKSGRAKFVDALIDEELLYLAAEKTDLKYDDDVKKQIRQAEKNILITAYYDKQIRQKVDVTDDEIEKYYNDHWEEFMNRSIMKAQHAFTRDSLKAVEWRKRLDNGEKFNRIAKFESEDNTTAPQNGELGYFNPGGYIKFYGESQEFSNQVKDLEIGDISDIIVTEKGYSIVKITDKKPENLKPLSEVRKQILEKLRGEKAKAELNDKISRLREEYKPVNFVREDIIRTTRTPEELWEMAQEESDDYTRIQYYRNIVNKYPDDKYAPQALFMIGFVYAEEVMDLVEARRTFDELLKKYPDSEVAGSARWMIENLNKPHPKFESVDHMKEKMEEDKGGED